MFKEPSYSSSWRQYQQRLKRASRMNYLIRKSPWIGGGLIVLLLLFLVPFRLIPAWFHREEKKQTLSAQETEKQQIETIQQAKAEVHRLVEIQALDFSPVLENYSFQTEQGRLQVKTSVDAALQDYIEKLLKQSLTLQAAVVVMQPGTGRILAMAEYQNISAVRNGNLCLQADYPAASLFKIVSAAAVIEVKNMSPDKPLFFRGRKYTLYKDQLNKEEEMRTARRTNLKQAFSGSINPVFGKIGIYDLGQSVLDGYAERFFFNRAIPFELPMAVSSLAKPDDDYGLAEMASGFNKFTKISPLHAAMITAAIANNGKMMDPWLVASIRNEKGEAVYQAQPRVLGRPIKPRTAERLRVLMEDTVKAGTCRRTFQELKRNKGLAEMEMGAKTGTINDELDQFKYDWITTYVLPPKKEEAICVSILTVHGEKLGMRAKELAKEIIQHYFSS